jgi:hypothetical protein
MIATAARSFFIISSIDRLKRKLLFDTPERVCHNRRGESVSKGQQLVITVWTIAHSFNGGRGDFEVECNRCKDARAKLPLDAIRLPRGILR